MTLEPIEFRFTRDKDKNDTEDNCWSNLIVLKYQYNNGAQRIVVNKASYFKAALEGKLDERDNHIYTDPLTKKLLKEDAVLRLRKELNNIGDARHILPEVCLTFE